MNEQSSPHQVFLASLTTTEQAVRDVSFLRIANVLLERWKVIVLAPTLAALLAATISFLVTPRFASEVRFVPEERQSGSSLSSSFAGLASQLGVDVDPSTDSPEFYAAVVSGRTLRDSVLTSKFVDARTAEAGDSVMLVDLLDVPGSGPGQLERARRLLDDFTQIRPDPSTKIVSLSVETPYPQLSADVANRFVDLLSDFNLQTRQSNARARRMFIEQRIARADSELTAAEDSVKAFLIDNRRYENSPQLEVEYERLRRQVLIKQEVASTLHGSYEEARIQEVNDTPVITVIDRAIAAHERSWPHRRIFVLVGFALGLVLGITAALTHAYLQGAREEQAAELLDLRSNFAGLRHELRSLLHPSRRTR